MKSTPNLSSLVPWYRVVALVTGKEPTTQAVPYKSECPRCAKALMTFQCTTGGGEWHHCQDCGFAGDNIEYAAFAWNTTPTSALAQLAVKLPNRQLIASRKDVESYVGEILKEREKAKAFWARCQKEYAAVPHVRDIREQLRLPEPTEKTRWDELFRPHVGALSRETVVHYFPDLAKTKQGLFQERKWSGCLVIPTWDLPGRISSFLFAAVVNGTSGIRVHEKIVLPGLQEGCTGLMFMNALKSKGPYLLVTDDLMYGMRLWSQHLSKRDTPIPLVLLPPGGSPTQMLRRRSESGKVIAWGQKTNDCRLVKIASELHPEACVAPAYTHFDREDCTARESSYWLERIEEKKRPWRDYLEDKFVDLPFETIVDALDSIKLSDQALKTFVSGCSSKVRTIVNEAMGYVPSKSVRFRSKTVLESSDGWFLDTGEMVSDVIIKFKTVSHRAKDDSVWYSGELVGQDYTVPFVAPKKTVETRTSDWMSKTLVAAGKTVPVVDQTWERHLCQIALLFGKPEVVSAPDRVGWDSRSVGFGFPGFFISSTGAVSERSFVSDPDLPCRNFHVPTGTTPLEFSALGQNKLLGKTVWPLAMYVTAAATQSVFAMPMPNLAIYGIGAPSARLLLEHLGVGAEDKCSVDSWPCLAKRTRVTPWDELLALKGRVCFTDEDEANSLHLRGWAKLQSPGSFEVSDSAIQAIRKIIPEALAAFGRQNRASRPDVMETFSMARHLLSGLAWSSDVATGWPYRELDFDLVFSSPDNQAAVCRSFFSLLKGAIHSNIVGFERSGYRMKTHSGRYSAVYADGKAWIPQEGLVAYAAARKLPPLQIAKIDRSLEAFPNKYFGKKSLDGATGWLVQESWINEKPCHDYIGKEPSRVSA